MKKIMFNDRYGLTKAVLEGRKTMTRRIIPNKDGLYTCFEETNRIYIRKDGVCVVDCGEYIERRIKSPNKVGDVLAVAQCYAEVHNAEPTYELQYALDNFILSYHKPESKKIQDVPGWKNKMFVRADLMPHQIKITNVRIELLGDITTEDIIKEGILQTNEGLFTFVGNKVGEFLTARCCFNALIDRICGKGTWLVNPLVWVYEFELIR